MSSSAQSMWSSGAGFQFEFARDYVHDWNTGSLPVNPPAVSGGGVTVDPNFAVSAWGLLGVGVGFGLESGLVNTVLDYDITLDAPVIAAPGEFIQINGMAELRPSSALLTASPSAHAYLDGILAVATNLPRTTFCRTSTANCAGRPGAWRARRRRAR